jgi:hypothetical protein
MGTLPREAAGRDQSPRSAARGKVILAQRIPESAREAGEIMRSAFHVAFTVGGGVLITFAWVLVFPLFLLAALAFVPRPFVQHGAGFPRL